MPQRLRTERRAFSRTAARRFAQPNPGHGPNRAARRARHQRGDIATLVHGPHDRAWLCSGTEHASGQDRINHKRTQRAEYWRTVTIQVSAEMEPYFRDSLHLLGKGTRIDGRRPQLNWFVIELDVHIPGAPIDAVRAEPTYRTEYSGDTCTTVLDRIHWIGADGNRFETGQPADAH